MMTLRENGTDVDVWEMDDLVEAVEEFIRQQQVENYADVSPTLQDSSTDPALEPVDIANNSEPYGNLTIFDSKNLNLLLEII